MIKLEVTETFTLEQYDKLTNVKSKTGRPGYYEPGDTFECEDTMAKYLLGDNALKKTVVKVVEVKEEAKEEKKETKKKKK